MRNIFATIVLAVMFVPAAGIANAACTRHVEPAGGYSLCPPEGWSIEQKGESPYKSFFGSPMQGFTPNINIYDETVDMPLPEYVTAGTKRAIAMAKEAGFTRVDVVSRLNFSTDSKERGIRVIYESEFKDQEIRTIQYAFNGKRGKKLIVTCTSPSFDRAAADPICDRAVKTFKTELK